MSDSVIVTYVRRIHVALAVAEWCPDAARRAVVAADPCGHGCELIPNGAHGWMCQIEKAAEEGAWGSVRACLAQMEKEWFPIPICDGNRRPHEVGIAHESDTWCSDPSASIVVTTLCTRCETEGYVAVPYCEIRWRTP